MVFPPQPPGLPSTPGPSMPPGLPGIPGMPDPTMQGPPQGPSQLPPELLQLLDSLPPQLRAIVEQMPPEVMIEFFTAPSPEAAMTILMQFVQGGGGAAPGGMGAAGLPPQGPVDDMGPASLPLPGTGGPPQGTGPGIDPNILAMMMGGGPMGPPSGSPAALAGMSPPMPGGPATAAPIGLMPDGSMSMMPGAPGPPVAPAPQGPPPPLLAPDEEVPTSPAEEGDTPAKRPKAPDYEAPPLPANKWGAKGPTGSQVESDMLRAERMFADRNDAIQEWHDVYYQQPQLDAPGWNRQRTNPYKQMVVIPSTQTTMADRAIGLVAPTADRLTYHADPPDDSAVSRDANQAKRNAARHIREELGRRHVRRVSNDGHVRPSIERVEGGIMAIEGSMPALVDLNPLDKHFPFTYEPLPVHRVYPMGHATLYIETCTLSELRSEYPKEVNELYPLDAENDRADEDSQVKICGWSDELWHGIWASLPGEGRSRSGRYKKKSERKGLWLKPMKRHNNGFRVYQYGLPALGSPLSPTDRETSIQPMHGVRGIYAAYVPLFRLQARIMSACADGAFKHVRPPYKIKLGNPNEDPPEIDDGPGGAGVVLKPGQDIEPLLSDLMASDSGRALLEFIGAMLGEMMPPVQQGRGQSASGADRFIAQQQAAALHIDPIISGIEATISYYLSLLLEAYFRVSKGRKNWVTPFPVKQAYRDPQSENGGRTLSVLMPEDIAICGPTVEVRYNRYSISERMQLGAFLKNMVDAKFMSRMDAMEELNVEDYERTLARQLAEAVYEDPDMVKANIEALLEEQTDPPLDTRKRAARRAVRINRAWKKRQLEQQKGSAAAPVGTPSPPANDGGAPMPGVPSMGMG